MLVHPLDDEGEIDTSANIAIVCLGTGYTIYERVKETVVKEEKRVVKLRIAQQDAYDFTKKEYPRYDFIERKFYSFKEAQKTVAENPSLFYGNKHDPLNEFVYECNARFSCSVCKKTYTSEKCKSCDDKYVCRFCHDHTGDDVTQVKQSLYLYLDELKKIDLAPYLMIKGEERFVFSNECYIDEELVYAGLSKDLPFLDIAPVIKSPFEKEKIIASVVDIETVNRKPKSFDKIVKEYGRDNIASLFYYLLVEKEISSLREESSDSLYDEYLRCHATIYDDKRFRSFVRDQDGLLRRDLLKELEANRRDTGEVIPDAIVSISVATYEGTNLIDVTYMCVVKPNCKSRFERRECSNHFYEKYADIVDERYDAIIRDGTLRSKLGSRLPPINMIYCHGGEEDIVLKFIRVMNTIRPHTVVTYNGNDFDFKFLIRSAFRYDINLAEKLCAVNPRFCDYKPLENIAKAKKALLNQNAVGFIKDTVLKLSHDTFMTFISTDLLLYNEGSLNQVCLSKLNVHKTDVSYSDIPDLLYSGSDRLMEYNCVDVFITGELYKAQLFDSVFYYFNLEKINGIPWDSAASKKRTPPAIMSSYGTYRHYQFTQPASLRPCRLHAKCVFRELINYFTHHTHARDFNGLMKTEDGRQIVLDFHGGACKLRKEYKKIEGFRYDGNRYMTQTEFYNCLKEQICQNKKLYDEYDTLALVVILSYLTSPKKESLSYDHFFLVFFDDYRNSYSFKDNKSRQLEIEKLKVFFYYLVVVRGPLGLSLCELMETLWCDYVDMYNTDTFFRIETVG